MYCMNSLIFFKLQTKFLGEWLLQYSASNLEKLLFKCWHLHLRAFVKLLMLIGLPELSNTLGFMGLVLQLGRAGVVSLSSLLHLHVFHELV
jgi:hypothetical protein